MRPIDADKITPDCEVIKSIVALHKKCKLQHKEGCFASTCEECLARSFSETYNHNLPLISDSHSPAKIKIIGGDCICPSCGFNYGQDSVRKSLKYWHQDYCKNCGQALDWE